jgi:putative endonuclease
MAAPPAPSELAEVTSTHDLGRRFEDAVAGHLIERGWRILDRNVRFRRKEVDLVARLGEVVAFVEVKGRRGSGYGHPLEAITWRKRREIESVAAWWIARFGEPGLVYRFDAASVEPAPDGGLVVRHLEDAWRPA